MGANAKVRKPTEVNVSQQQLARIRAGQLLRNQCFIRCKVNKSNLDYAPAQKY